MRRIIVIFAPNMARERLLKVLLPFTSGRLQVCSFHVCSSSLSTPTHDTPNALHHKVMNFSTSYTCTQAATITVKAKEERELTLLSIVLLPSNPVALDNEDISGLELEAEGVFLSSLLLLPLLLLHPSHNTD